MNAFNILHILISLNQSFTGKIPVDPCKHYVVGKDLA